MPSYTTTTTLRKGTATAATVNDYAACKCVSVFPQNSQTNGKFSSHQGVVLLWNISGNGQLLLILDAHEITKIRTAAASAVATRVILGGGNKVDSCHQAKVLSILGTGDQARSHIEAMRLVLPNLERIQIWGRHKDKAQKLCHEIIQNDHDENKNNDASIIPSITVHDSVASCIDQADVICTVTSAMEPILTKNHIPLLKPGCHLNVVGACEPQFHEIDPEVFDHCVKGGGGSNTTAATTRKIVTDSIDACLQEPGDILAYEKMATKGLQQQEVENKDDDDFKANFCSLGDLLLNKVNVSNVEALGKGISVFKSQGIAVEDLFVAKRIYEKIQESV